jgi:hypothetical protein
MDIEIDLLGFCKQGKEGDLQADFFKRDNIVVFYRQPV